MLDGVLVGFIFCLSLVASLFFLKFWRATHDQLFIAFAVAFVIEGLSRIVSLLTINPTEGSPIIYVVRLAGYLVILFAIFRKNRKPRSP